MPQLEELCVAYNNLSDVSEVHGFDNLRFLDCSSCNFTSWNDQVQCFGKLPALEHFMLNDNDIADISMETVDGSCFTKLRSLQLAGTSIASWRDLDGIRSFKSLESLRFRNTPLTRSMGAGEARSITIARIPNLTYLNASPISSKERVEAERRYVSSVARDLLLADEKEPVLALHPRFQQLAELHKDSMVTSATAVGGGPAMQPVNVTIRSMVADSCSMEPLQKRLPGGLKVGRLKAMCLRAFGLDMERQLLHVRREVRLKTTQVCIRCRCWLHYKLTFFNTTGRSVSDRVGRR
jgi:Leucine-rich repeat (LRR) protein